MLVNKIHVTDMIYSNIITIITDLFILVFAGAVNNNSDTNQESSFLMTAI